MVHALLDRPVLELDRGEFIFRLNIHTADSIDKSLDCREVDLYIVVDCGIKQLLFGTDSRLHSVESGVCQLVHRVVVVRHVYLVVSRDGRHEDLMRQRIDGNDHVYVAPALCVYLSVDIDTCDHEVERLPRYIGYRAVVIYRRPAQEGQRAQ